MRAGPRVLYLAPPGRHPDQLSRRSFLDEEIRALAAAGVHAYVLSENIEHDEDVGRIHLRSLPPDSPIERRRTLTFLAHCIRAVPVRNLADVRRSFRALSIERRAAEVVACEGIHLIHSYFGWPGGFGGLLARVSTGVPLVAGLRGCDVNVAPSIGYGSRLTPSFDRSVRRLLRCADVTVSVSEFLRGEAIRLGAPPARARVILKGVRLDLFNGGAGRDRARAQLGIGSRPMLLAVSGLVPVKGLSDVLVALAALRSSHDFVFVICGEGPLRDALVWAAHQLGLAPRTQFMGRVSREVIRTYFAAADLFVQGSLMEASGNALLEAMASGLPIVCTDAGGPREYVEDCVTGFVVPVGRPAIMSDRIRLLLDDADFRRECGRRARMRAEAQFSYARMIEETLALYDELLGRSEYAPRPVSAALG